jgi:hypothetical protein
MVLDNLSHLKSPDASTRFKLHAESTQVDVLKEKSV